MVKKVNENDHDYNSMLVKRIKLILGSRKLRILSSFRFEALRKVSGYRLVSEGKIFQLFEAKGKFWKIKTVDQAFSQRTSAGRFGTTFSTKGGGKKENYLGKTLRNCSAETILAPL